MTKEEEAGIVEKYQALVVSIAAKYVFKSHHLSLQDLIQEGNIGLLKATRKFDPRIGTKCITYVYPWIKASITRAIREQGTTMRVPNHMYDAIKVQQNKHDDETPVLKVTRESDISFLSRTKHYLSQYDDCQVTDLRGLENSPGATDVFADVSNKFLNEKLTSMVDDLCFREKEVLKHRFPFLSDDNQTSLTFKELGEELGITDTRAHQIEKEALQKLKWKMIEDACSCRAVA